LYIHKQVATTLLVAGFTLTFRRLHLHPPARTQASFKSPVYTSTLNQFQSGFKSVSNRFQIGLGQLCKRP